MNRNLQSMLIWILMWTIVTYMVRTLMCLNPMLGIAAICGCLYYLSGGRIRR